MLSFPNNAKNAILSSTKENSAKVRNMCSVCEYIAVVSRLSLSKEKVFSPSFEMIQEKR
jgi:hypothetical protein